MAVNPTSSIPTGVIAQKYEGNQTDNKAKPNASALKEGQQDSKFQIATADNASKTTEGAKEMLKPSSGPPTNPGESQQMQNQSNQVNINAAEKKSNAGQFLTNKSDGTPDAKIQNNTKNEDSQRERGTDSPGIHRNDFRPPTDNRKQVNRRGSGGGRGGQGRNKRQANLPGQKGMSIIQGATVSESKTQDMFIPSGMDSVSNAMKGVHNRSVIEQLKDYNMGQAGTAVFHNVCANADLNVSNSIGANMQKAMFSELARHLTEVDDVYSKEYQQMMRDIIQGAMKAAKKYDIGGKEITKMLITGILHLSPHNDNPDDMEEVMRLMASEIIYGKVNLGYSMKTASYNLGAALNTLSMYLKNYQSEVEYSKDLEDRLSDTVGDAVWYATGEITNYSRSQAQANLNQLIAGRAEEGQENQNSAVKNSLLSPFKKVENNQFVRGIMSKFGK